MPDLTELDFDPVEGEPGEYRLTRPFVFQDGEQTYMIPAGYVTDLASIPPSLRWLIPRAGTHRAAVIHDFAYEYGYLIVYQRHDAGAGAFERTVVSRNLADQLFKRHLIELGVGLVRARLMYLAVSLFGGSVWARARAKRP